ncbi:hypothetical protein Celal_1392 [Cellulophaga algicola DSM 14237]|uniref:Uncharacterized protein n=1 Tax=Cellulophaga algicola (strain DSM 14237 / IC166 / ACAM 630) TaxID=688270 RepID=E6X8W0_CELAD|nr:hypothetical protein [Cellulophaga algicola]ADV48705.1 hypothetical protein Celal_1392 [Cellulophaga algicola DSM 14237]
MPFIIDLPPSNTHVESVKTEMISIEGSENNIPTIDDRSIVFEKDLYENIYLNDKFKSLVELWEQNTAFESSISNIIQEDNFKKIINLGKKAVPLIIDKIEYEPSVLVWALNIITGKSMSSGGRETIEQICKKWVNAFRTGRIQNV